MIPNFHPHNEIWQWDKNSQWNMAMRTMRKMVDLLKDPEIPIAYLLRDPHSIPEKNSEPLKSLVVKSKFCSSQIGKSNGLGNYKLMFKFYHYVVADVILHLSIFKIGNIIQQISILIKLHLKKISIFTVWKCLWWFVILSLPNSMQFSVP